MQFRNDPLSTSTDSIILVLVSCLLIAWLGHSCRSGLKSFIFGNETDYTLAIKNGIEIIRLRDCRLMVDSQMNNGDVIIPCNIVKAAWNDESGVFLQIDETKLKAGNVSNPYSIENWWIVEFESRKAIGPLTKEEFDALLQEYHAQELVLKPIYTLERLRGHN